MRWLVFSLGTLVAWGLWGFMARAALLDLNWQLLLPLTILGYLVPLIVLWIMTRPNLGRVRWARSFKGIILGSISGVSLMAFYRAVETGEASVVVPMIALYPALTLIGALLLLKESITATQLSGILLALLAGVLIARG